MTSATCWSAVIDGVEISLISYEYLKKNKRAAARHKDLNDLENLPDNGVYNG